jgi:hypothetical protein
MTAGKSALQHLLLRNKFGEDLPLRKILLVTSKWDSLRLRDRPPSHDEAVESLKRDNWKLLVKPRVGAGARVMKWDRDAPEEGPDNAKDVVESVLRGVVREQIDPVQENVQKDDIVILWVRLNTRSQRL